MHIYGTYWIFDSFVSHRISLYETSCLNKWIDNYIQYFTWDVITYQSLISSSCSLRQSALKLCYVRVIASHNCMWTLSLIDALNSIIAIWRNSITPYIKQILTVLHYLGFGSHPLWQCMCWMDFFDKTTDQYVILCTCRHFISYRK